MIKQLKEFGLIQHWKQIEMDKVAKITQNGDSAAEFKGLTLSNLQVHIFLMIYYIINISFILRHLSTFSFFSL